MALTERVTGAGDEPTRDAPPRTAPPRTAKTAKLDATVSPDEATRILRRGAVLVGLIWLPMLAIWSGLPFALTFDDSFYYAEIARNLTHGAGSTFDTINVTNGYHPLWLGLSLPVFLVGLDGVAAIRALLIVQLAMWVATLWVVASIAGRRLGGCPRIVPVLAAAALGLTGANPFVMKMVVNGMEAAPAVLLAVLLLDRVDRHDGKVLAGSQLSRLVTGALLGLAFLARTDAVLLLVCVAAWCMVEARNLRADETLTTARSHAVAKARAEVLVLPSLTVLAYSAINLAWFGHLSQVSGDVKRADATPTRALLLLAFAAVAVALMAWLGHPRRGKRERHDDKPLRFPRVASFCAHTPWYAAFLVLAAGYYLVLSSQLWLWYFAPFGLYATILLVLVTADLADGARLETPERPAHRAVLPIAAILGVPLLAALVIQTRTFADPNLRSIQEADRQAAAWTNGNLPDDAVLGSWDAGVIGYFADRPVMNLDGVANSFEYLDAMRSGTQAQFLRDRHLTHLINHGAVVNGEDPEIHEATADLLGEAAADGLTQVHRVEFTYSGTTTGTSGPSSTVQMATFVYELP